MRAPAVRDRGHDPPVVQPIRTVPAADHPAVEVGIDPVADRPVQLGVQRVGRGGTVGRAEQDVGAHVVERLALEDPDRGDPATIGRPGGVIRPAVRGKDLARFGDRARAAALVPPRVDVDGPDRLVQAQVGIGSASGGERDRPAVGVPCDVLHAPVASGDLAGSRPRAIHDEQVRPPIQVSFAIPAPVGTRDAASEGRGWVGGPLARLPADRGHLALEEARRVDLGGERQASPVRRPRQLPDGAMATRLHRPDPVGLSDVQQLQRGRSVVVGGIGADEGQRVAVGAEAWLRVADDPARELARPRERAALKVDGEQVAEVAVALDRAADDDRELAVGREIQLLDDDDTSEVLGGHRSAARHGRKRTRDARLPGCPSRQP